MSPDQPSSRSPQRVAVVGLGVMGSIHARVLREMGVDVVTVDCDRSVGADHRKLSAVRRKLDAVCVAVPHEHLAEQTWDAAQRGYDVLVEKPLAVNALQAEDLVDLLEARCEGATFGVGFVERCNPAVIALKQQLPRIGRVRHVDAQRLGPPARTPVSPVFDLMTHDLDILRFLDLGLPRAIGVAGHGGQVQGRFALVRGTDAALSVSLEHDERYRVINVTGKSGVLVADCLNRTLVLRTEDGDEQLPVGDADPLTEQWRRMLAGSPAAGLRDGLAALQAAEQVSALHQVHAF